MYIVSGISNPSDGDGGDVGVAGAVIDPVGAGA